MSVPGASLEIGLLWGKIMNSTLFAAAAVALTAGCAVTPHDAAAPPAPNSWDAVLGTTVTSDWLAPEHRAFDFWIGEWEANWRPRQEGQLRHDNEGTWTRQRVFPILDGKAIVELAESRGADDGAPSARGFSIRYYDPSRAKWIMAQHWPSPNFDGIAFTDQLIGAEHHGRLAMYSLDSRPKTDGSRDHRRYNFSDIAPNRFRWDGANSSDVGATWTTWQAVDFHRTGPKPKLPDAGTPFPGVYAEHLCPDPPHRELDRLEGFWSGVVERDGTASPARLTIGRMLDGCAVAGVLDHISDGHKRFIAWSYSSTFGSWVEFSLDNAPGSTHAYRLANSVGRDAVFTQAPGLAIKDDMTAFLAREAFDTSAANSRTVWREVSADTLVFEEQLRPTPDAQWETAARYELLRIED